MIRIPGVLIADAFMVAWCAVTPAADITGTKHVISENQHDDPDGIAAMDMDNDGNENFIRQSIGASPSGENVTVTDLDRDGDRILRALPVSAGKTGPAQA